MFKTSGIAKFPRFPLIVRGSRDVYHLTDTGKVSTTREITKVSITREIAKVSITRKIVKVSISREIAIVDITRNITKVSITCNSRSTCLGVCYYSIVQCLYTHALPRL